MFSFSLSVITVYYSRITNCAVAIVAWSAPHIIVCLRDKHVRFTLSPATSAILQFPSCRMMRLYCVVIRFNIDCVVLSARRRSYQCAVNSMCEHRVKQFYRLSL